MLDKCLLTDEEMALGPEGWAQQFEDPLPPWDVEVHEEEDDIEGEEGEELDDSEKGRV
jgi:hypothetical protein